METIGEVADAAMYALVREQRTELNQLADDVTSSGTVLELTFRPDGLAPGHLVGIGDEVMYVTRVDQEARQIDVLRGQFGSEPAAHSADDTVLVGARFFPAEALAATLAEIDDLGERLFSVSTASISAGCGEAILDLDGSDTFPEVFRILRIKVADPYHRARPWVSAKADLLRDMPTDAYPSGRAIALRQTLRRSATVRVTYAHSLDVSTMGRATTLESIGLPRHAADAVVFGAAFRLLGTREATASDRFAQGDSRRDEEVLPQAAMRTADWFRLQRDRLVGMAEARLLAQYGWTRS